MIGLLLSVFYFTEGHELPGKVGGETHLDFLKTRKVKTTGKLKIYGSDSLHELFKEIEEEKQSEWKNSKPEELDYPCLAWPTINLEKPKIVKVQPDDTYLATIEQIGNALNCEVASLWWGVVLIPTNSKESKTDFYELIKSQENNFPFHGMTPVGFGGIKNGLVYSDEFGEFLGGKLAHSNYLSNNHLPTKIRWIIKDAPLNLAGTDTVSFSGKWHYKDLLNTIGFYYSVKWTIEGDTIVIKR